MAGDIGIRERAIILPNGAAAAAQSALPDKISRVRHVYGPRLIIAEVPPDSAATVRAGLPGEAIEAEADRLPLEVQRQLTPGERLGLDALALRQSPDYSDAKANRKHANADWDSGVAQIPEFDHEHGPSVGSLAMGEAPTSAQLTGSVAVGIIIVEGPTANLKFSAAERTKVVAEVQNGLGWLASQSPVGVTYVYDIQIITLTTPPGPATLNADQKEALWRDPAMKKLGFGAGLGGVTAYIEGLRTKFHTNWAYCAFFVKYPIYHFAYASIGGPRIVMDYNNDGWGPDNIDRVFAHESGHIFGCPDEYASSGCNCGGSFGVYGKPNGNCANCAPGGGVDCLMKQNTWAMCPLTPYHLGFPLVEQTYSGVWRQGTDPYYLWVNASWDSFKAKVDVLAKQNLRLADIKITRTDGVDRYHGVWRAGTGGYYLWVNANWASFSAKWQELGQQNLRLVDLEVTNFGGELRYSGVWLPGNDSYYLWVNATWENFVAKWTELAKQNLRLVDLRIVNVGGQDRYFGAWRAGTGGYYLWVNANWDAFQAKWQELAKQNLRLVDLEITGSGGQKRYSGVWLPGTDGYYLWVGASYQEFHAKWEQLADQGLRLIDLDVVPASGPQSPLQGTEVAAMIPGLQAAAGADHGGLAERKPADPSLATVYAGRSATAAIPTLDGTHQTSDAGEGFGGGQLGAAARPSNGRHEPAESDAGAGFGGGDLGSGTPAQADQTGSNDAGAGFGGGHLGSGAAAPGQHGPADADAGFGGGVVSSGAHPPADQHQTEEAGGGFGSGMMN